MEPSTLEALIVETATLQLGHAHDDDDDRGNIPKVMEPNHQFSVRLEVSMHLGPRIPISAMVTLTGLEPCRAP